MLSENLAVDQDCSKECVLEKALKMTEPDSELWIFFFCASIEKFAVTSCAPVVCVDRLCS